MSKHVVITPVKDEEQFVSDLIESMLSQTIKPDLWIFVDDSSIDQSKEIILQATEDHTWIRYLYSGSLNPRSRGKKIADLFILGLNSCDISWEFCSKIDADMVLPKNYFEEIFYLFKREEKLGICSGNTYFIKKGKERMEKVMPSHTRGGLKTYRRDCLDDIGGIPPVDGWDGIDNILAASKGWETRNIRGLFALHQRKTGSMKSKLQTSYEIGVRSHYMGYGSLYMIVKSIHYGMKTLSLFSSILMIWGFTVSMIKKKARYGDGDFVRTLRRQKSKELVRMFSYWKGK